MNATKPTLLASLLAGLLLPVFQTHAGPDSVDLSFDPGSVFPGRVQSVVVQPDGKILIGGGFTTFPDDVRSGVARFNADGSFVKPRPSSPLFGLLKMEIARLSVGAVRKLRSSR